MVECPGRSLMKGILMNKFMFAFTAMSAVMATPALAGSNANFVGPRVALTAGADNVQNARNLNDVTYGAQLGLDAPLGKSFTAGVEVNAANVFGSTREIGVAARLGYAATDNILLYGKAGYANYRSISFRNRASTLDGLKVGGGVQFAVTKHLYTGLEYAYGNFNQGVGTHSVKAAVGLRF